MNRHRLSATLVGLLPLAGCDRPAPKPASIPPPTPPSQNTAAPVVTQTAPAERGLSVAAQPGTTPAAPATPAGGTVEIGPFVAVLPAGWVAEPPSNTMRVAQFKLPLAEGDTEPAELIVSHFRGGGGDTEDNLKRWASQFQGDPVALFERAAKQEKQVSGLTVTTFDLAGTFVPPNFGRGPAPTPKPNHRMLAAIVTTAQGPYFFKAIGPETSMAAQADAFVAFVSSLKKK